MIEQHIFHGAPAEIGEMHGRTFAEDITKTLEIYLTLWNCPQEQIPAKVQGYKKSVQEFFPHLAEEIKGIAKGSGVPEDFIYAINSRTELLGDASLIECTAVGISKSAKGGGNLVLAQNWDWVNSLRGLTKVVELQPKDKPRMKMLIEPGMVGKIGMNEASIGVCLNFLETPQMLGHGIPVHVLLRGIVEQVNYSNAYKLISSLPRAASANYLLGSHHSDDDEDYEKEIGSIETTPENIFELEETPFITHTNSYNAKGEVCDRQEIFKAALWRYLEQDSERIISPENLKKAFKIPGVQFPASTTLGGIETLHTVIMNLTQGRFLVSEGVKSDAFSVYEFE